MVAAGGRVSGDLLGLRLTISYRKDHGNFIFSQSPSRS